MNDAQLEGATLILLALAGGMVLFLWLALRLMFQQLKAATRELDKERTAHNVTRDRLLASHRDGFLIPPAPPPQQEEDLLDLPESLAPIWEQWEAESSQKKTREIVRGQYQSGRSVKSILDEWGFGPPQVEQE